MLEPPWFTVTATTIEAEPSSQSLEFRPGQGGVWQIEQKHQAEAAEFSGCLGVGSLLLSQRFSPNAPQLRSWLGFILDSVVLTLAGF